jgi:TPR repeat protein/serine/threonine protein kinase
MLDEKENGVEQRLAGERGKRHDRKRMPSSDVPSSPIPAIALPPTAHEGAKVFGRFSLVRELGRGGFGVVWLAQDEELELSVALKFLPEMVARDEDSIEELKREIKRGLALNHAGIVRVHNFLRDEAIAAISMEYVDGPTLRAIKREQPGGCFDAVEITAWVRQLGDVLSYVHERVALVHRDLKPGNLMLTSAGDLKVADFGIASSISDSMTRISLRSPGSGTPAYMSPQQALGHAPAVTDDIYATGATVYELLTGKPPFFRGEILMQVQSVIPPTMNQRRAELGVEGKEPIPASWEELIAACLAKDPAQRPQSMRELVAVLDDAIYALPAMIAPPPLPSSVVIPASALETATAPAHVAPTPAAPTAFFEPTPAQSTRTFPPPTVREGNGLSWSWLIVCGFAVMALGGALAWYFTSDEKPVTRKLEVKTDPKPEVKTDNAQESVALFKQGWACEHALNGKRDVKRARGYYERAAQLGSAAAKGRLARFYVNGDGVPADDKKAAKLMEEAAAANDAVALNLMGARLLEGDPSERDPERGREYYERAADLEYPRAVDNLALLYRAGRGVTPDMARAETLLKRAFDLWQRDAETGDLDAQERIGWHYKVGLGVARDPAQAFKFFELAARKGHPQALLEAAGCYEDGIGTAADLGKAFEYYKECAASENAVGQYRVGYCLDLGKGVQRDPKQAASWYQRSAAQKYPEAMTALGLLYENGDGVPRNPQQAVTWYRQAATLEDGKAQSYLARCYEKGVGIPADMAQAVSWYEKAVVNDNADAEVNLGNILFTGRSGRKDMERAVVLYKKAELQNHPAALNNLGACYERGEGVEKDVNRAINYYKRAAAAGSADGAASLKRLGR